MSTRCVVTGASGFVGGRVRAALGAAGFAVEDWSRRGAGSGGRRFVLGEPVDPAQLAGARALVHCAYDFEARGWPAIEAANVRGSERLFAAAREAGVARIVHVSSLSAFEGCRSLYGRAKLAAEASALEHGARVLRPGLVWAEAPGGVFGGLVAQVRRLPVVPLVAGDAPQYLVHGDDLGAFVARVATGDASPPAAPVRVAHLAPQSLRVILRAIAAALGTPARLAPVPWRAAWLGLRALEALRLPAPFRSDSLLGLVFQEPSPSFALAEQLGARCRPFALAPGSLAAP